MPAFRKSKSRGGFSPLLQDRPRGKESLIPPPIQETPMAKPVCQNVNVPSDTLPLPMFACHKCSSTFFQKKTLIQHMQDCHVEDNIDVISTHEEDYGVT